MKSINDNLFYITNSNFKKLFRQVKNHFVIDEPSFDEELEGMKFYFTEQDTLTILLTKIFLEDPTKVIEFYHRLVAPDGFITLIPPTIPAYHSSRKCEFLKSKFENIFLPIPFRGNEVLTNQLRAVVVTTLRLRFIHEVSILIFFDNWDAIFENLKHNKVLIKEFERLGFSLEKLDRSHFIPKSAENSGAIKISAKVKLFKKYEEFELDYKSSAKRKGYKNDRAFEKEANVKFRSTYAKDFKDLLIDFYIEKFNPNLAFVEWVLSKLGFNPCLQCGKQEETTRKKPIQSEKSPYIEEDEFSLEALKRKLEEIQDKCEILALEGFTVGNSETNPLETAEISYVSPGLYFCTHKFTRKLQFALRREGKGYNFIDIPVDKKGKMVIKNSYVLLALKAKDVADKIKSNNIPWFLALPLPDNI